MPAFTASAPGKIILFGEHAVVYGEPAIAAPLQATQARAVVTPQIAGKSGEIRLEAPDIGLSSDLIELGNDHPLRRAITLIVGEDNLNKVPACQIQITSSIPISSGLGSSAAITAALIQAFSAFIGQQMTEDQISQTTFEVEKIHHGRPSGIDNSVVVFQQPVYYQKGIPLEFLTINSPFSILIAGSGSPGNTRQAVTSVREGWLKDPEKYNEIFSKIGQLTRHAKELLLSGDPQELGPLMDQNQSLLQDLGVSTPRLDRLVQSARKAGALGAKLSGGGLGGHLIALVDDQTQAVQEKLLEEGAEGIFQTRVGGPLLSQ